MEKGTRIVEPEVERWDETASEEEEQSSDPALEIFSLSGGVMKTGAQTANRIDGLLTKMLENPGSCRYVGDIDKNLDYLFTHLQLDMIGRVANDAVARDEKMAREATPTPEPFLSLDRSRSSI